MFAQLYQNGILKNPKTVFLLLWSLTLVRGIWLKPYIRKISSTISASPSISGLNLGTVILKTLSIEETNTV